MAPADAPKRLTIDDIKPPGREVVVVDWPGRDRKVGLLHINCEEEQDSYFAMRSHFRKKDQSVDLFSQEATEAEEMLQQVYRMLIDPAAKVADYRVFSDADQARRRLSMSERAFFCRLHDQLFAGPKGEGED